MADTAQAALDRCLVAAVMCTATAEEFTAYDGIQAAQRLAHATATAAGWYHDRHTGEPIKRNVGRRIAAVCRELRRR